MSSYRKCIISVAMVSGWGRGGEERERERERERKRERESERESKRERVLLTTNRQLPIVCYYKLHYCVVKY